MSYTDGNPLDVITGARHEAQLSVTHEGRTTVLLDWTSYEKASEAEKKMAEVGVIVDMLDRWNYGSMYADVEALHDQIGQVYGNGESITEPQAVILYDNVRDALSMILAHDRARRDYEYGDDGHCRHGVYVGGSGADYMCGACEEGSE